MSNSSLEEDSNGLFSDHHSDHYLRSETYFLKHLRRAKRQTCRLREILTIILRTVCNALYVICFIRPLSHQTSSRRIEV
ncbi:hypothetical protein MPTK1_2g12500 [Marchantia polymorpha subsp. ruderalis]|uniref:Uncharacterized protein n=1 Tax=Marchantia polymorpha TaxID=3197 RepID=A0A2R6XAV7_MARPO|nr:hypothetical protein MARPO_0026s0121 [Marchantia polymorpha]BBN02070.1 hypothetical protein Mp_2g12500 [Marchantia polymorpha subsp. ruderalis]|eukprot:PTQ43251.1 hypothetical protein MARPO_0026s0121 [Marchantia polymorpha]